MSEEIKVGKLPLDLDGIPVCPPPTNIETIKVKKVFEECMNTQVEAVTITGWSADTTQATEVNCMGVESSVLSCTINPDAGTVTVVFEIQVTAQVPLDTGGFDTQSNLVTITKTFSLSRAGEEGLEAQCHIFPECLKCFISARDQSTNAVTEVTCCVGILILVKLDAEVQLLIPSYGFAPEPPECEEVVDECPATYDPEWPPYPPDDNTCGSTGKGCPCKR